MAMSQEHKDALARGRRESRAIKNYLKTIESRKPGRPVTKESLTSRLATVNSKLEGLDDPLKRLDLLQSRLDIEEALASVKDVANLDQIEADFVANAKGYSQRKGISYTAWRRFGVPAAVLKKAGIPETRRR
ncbi:MAG TPA: hypothetical protein VFL72_01250 [Acidimicrobiia bacterium]|nr:hypothetical protein [Acidimicrobiia bacterium]